MVKKGKRVALEVSPSYVSYPVIIAGEDAKARFRFHSLTQDYQELLKESEAKKKRLQELQKMKFMLLAEVKFLRKKHKSFCENPSQETLYRLNKQTHRMPSTSGHATESSLNPGRIDEHILIDLMQKASHSKIPTEIPVPDLKQRSFPNGEDMHEFQVESEPLQMDKQRRCLLEGATMVCDLNVPVCNGSSRLGKRKLTWQDQVALRV